MLHKCYTLITLLIAVSWLSGASHIEVLQGVTEYKKAGIHEGDPPSWIPAPLMYSGYRGRVPEYKTAGIHKGDCPSSIAADIG